MKNNLPPNWIEVELEDIFNFIYGKGLSVNNLLEEGFDVYGANGIIGKYNEFLYESSKIIISCRGAASGTIHKTKPKAFITSNSIIFDEKKKEIVDIDFIKYMMTFIDKSEVITGTAQPQITIQLLNKLSIPLTTIHAQKRIATKLDTLFAQLDTIRTSLDKIPQLLKNFRQQVLTQAVTGKLTEDWRLRRDFGKWNKMTIGELFTVKTGATPSKSNEKYYQEGTVSWVKSGEVNNCLIYQSEEYITELAISETNAKVFPKDTILIAMYGEGKTRGQVGWLKICAATNQAIAALVNEDLCIETKKYVYFFCLSQYEEIRKKAVGGNQPNLNLSKIKEWEIYVPNSLEEQQEIVQRVEALFSKADKIEEMYQSLKQKIDTLPQAILHKAFKGELVPQLPTDGDARDLLKQIEELNKSIKKK